ncbi:hypothetical protein DEO72_LG6g478 [Vigna unguiculata]|uniref:Uncharacterized protein n=1 Tax=Vigna unguiculata TaxID=3917 RepID=A0A4D6M3G8_VIGUN|nr:hypothetical protein DEO72_LG6g478 [Vigna unguiculata]
MEEEKKKSGGSAGPMAAEGSSQRGDMLPPPVEKKRGKRHDRPSKPGTPRAPSPKKTRNAEEGGQDALSALFDAQLKINEGIEVSLSLEEVEIVLALRLETVLYALNEFQVRAMVIGRHLETVLSKLPDSSRLSVEIQTLQRDLAEANQRRQKVSLQLGSVKNERSQLLGERNTLKARCKELEMKDEESQTALERLEERLAALQAEHIAALERIYELEGYVMAQHEEGFYKAVRQTAHLFNFDAGDDRINIEKDVYDGVLMSIDDIASAKVAASDPGKVSSPPSI